MDIAVYIRELLLDHDCVILPDFGGFIGNYVPAHYDSSNNFYPPTKQISFNKQLCHNDGLLIGKVSKSLTLNYGDARNLVERYIASMKKRLDDNERVVIDQLGEFSKNREGGLQFEPVAGANYFVGSYGLGVFPFERLEGYDVKGYLLRKNDSRSTAFSARKLLWRAAVVIPFVALAVAVPLKMDLFTSKVETSSLNPLTVVEFEEEERHSSELAIPVEESALAQPITPQPTEQQIVEPPVVVSSTVKYCVVTGSFKMRENAENQVKSLLADGYQPEIIETSNSFYRVTALLCDDMDEANDNRKRLLGHYPDAWVTKY